MVRPMNFVTLIAIIAFKLAIAEPVGPIPAVWYGEGDPMDSPLMEATGLDGTLLWEGMTPTNTPWGDGKTGRFWECVNILNNISPGTLTFIRVPKGWIPGDPNIKGYKQYSTELASAIFAVKTNMSVIHVPRCQMVVELLPTILPFIEKGVVCHGQDCLALGNWQIWDYNSSEPVNGSDFAFLLREHGKICLLTGSSLTSCYLATGPDGMVQPEPVARLLEMWKRKPDWKVPMEMAYLGAESMLEMIASYQSIPAATILESSDNNGGIQQLSIDQGATVWLILLSVLLFVCGLAWIAMLVGLVRLQQRIKALEGMTRLAFDVHYDRLDGVKASQRTTDFQPSVNREGRTRSQIIASIYDRATCE